MQHSKKYIATGIFVSNLVLVFVGAFLYPWFKNIVEMEQGIALALIITITLITFCSAIAGYFWSFTGIQLKSLRLLAIVNHIWVLFLFIFHPVFGIGNDSALDFLLYNFFTKGILFIIIICSMLGNWFGRRFFYE